MTMLFDSNIVIYSVQPENVALSLFLDSVPGTVSIVSYIEALAYHRLTLEAELRINEFLSRCTILPLTDNIADQAIALRRQRRMGLGDAIIAATAITHNLALVTRNTEDFRWINGLDLLDPLST